jgi:hypothetical protein
MAAPAAPQTIEWDGNEWGNTQSILSGNSWFANVACVSATECFAPSIPSTSNGQQPYRFNGESWTAGPPLSTASTNVISCATSGLCAWFSSDTGASTLADGQWSVLVNLFDDVSAQQGIELSCAASFCMALAGGEGFLYSSTLEGEALGPNASVSASAPAGPGASAAAGASSPGSAPTPYLGSATWAASLPDGGIAVQGFGQITPSTIDLGGNDAAGGIVQSITWSNWGSQEAIGMGSAVYVTDPNQPVSDQPVEPVTVVAYDLGSCDGGPPAYTTLNWYFPTEGQSLDPATAIDACTGLAAGPESSSRRVPSVCLDPIGPQGPGVRR